MTSAAIHAGPSRSIGDHALKAASILWFLTAAAGQCLFVVYIFGFFGPPILRNTLSDWNKKEQLVHGHIAGDDLGNLAFGIHVMLAAILTLGGLLQLIPQIRAFDIRLHRWNGRVFLTTVVIVTAAGLFMNALRDDPALPLKFGADDDFRKFSVVGLIAHASSTMREALAQINRYGRLVVEVDGVVDGARFENVMLDGRLYLVDRRRDPNAFPELTETTFSRFICGSRRDYPRETLAFAAEVTHSAPPHWRDYQAIWKVPVAFESDRNAIEMNPAWPSLVIQEDNRYAFGILAERAETLLAELEASETFRSAVEKSLLAVLHTGPIGAAAIAAQLGMSRQTLFRRLKSEGASFEGTLDDLRRRLALDYIRTRKISLNEAAYLVGYSDISAFSRAFKRWEGVSPRTFLRRNERA